MSKETVSPQSGRPISYCTALSPRPALRAFTLVELLVVIGLIVVLMALMGPAMNAIKGANDVTKTVYDLASTLEQARAYAIANHTYAWVGIGEFDASKNASATPQVPGDGRVVIAVVASRDGTRGYDATNNNLAVPPWPDNKGSTLTAVTPVRSFENVHLAAFNILNGPNAPDVNTPNSSVGSGNMLRPLIQSTSYVLTGLSMSSGGSVTQFSWPLGSALGAGKYTFPTVIHFDPQGSVRIQTKTNQAGLAQTMEIGLQTAHGNVVDANSKNVAALQLNCTTGRTRIYRP